MGQRLAGVARPGVRDERHAANLEAGPPGGDALEHRRHPDRVGAERPEHPDLGRGLVLRPEQAGVDALLRSTPSALRRRRAGARGGAGSRRRSGPGTAARSSSAFGPRSGVRPVRLRWSAMTISVPGPKRRVDAAGRVRQDDEPGPEPARTAGRAGRRGRGRCPRRCGTGPGAWHGRAVEPAEQQPPDVPGRGRGRPARQVGERDRDGVLEVVGQPAEPRAEHDPDRRHDVRPGADGGLERVEPGGLLGGRDRAAGSMAGRRSASVASRRAGLRNRVQGEDGRGPRLRRPDGRTDTGMPVAVRRAFVTRESAESRRPGTTKRPKRPAWSGGP